MYVKCTESRFLKRGCIYLFESQNYRNGGRGRDVASVFYPPSGCVGQRWASPKLGALSGLPFSVEAQALGTSAAAFPSVLMKCVRNGTAGTGTRAHTGCSCCRWCLYLLCRSAGPNEVHPCICSLRKTILTVWRNARWWHWFHIVSVYQTSYYGSRCCSTVD